MAMEVSRYVASIPKSPFYKIVDYVRELGLQDKVLYLNVGLPRFDTPKHILTAASKASQESFTKYTPEAGIMELREAISAKLKKENRIEADPNSEIFVTCGAQAGLYVALKTLLNTGDEVLIPSPFYPPYYAHTLLMGAKPVLVPYEMTDGLSLNPEDIEKAITPRSRAIFIHTPNNPVGGVLSKENLSGICDVVLKHGLTVISDEPYEKILFDGAEHTSIGSLPGMKDHTITLNSLSKTYSMTGLRLGYAVANSDFMTSFLKVHHAINICANSIAQKAGVAALNGPHDFLEDWQKEYDSNRNRIVTAIDEMPKVSLPVKPMGTFYCFLNIKEMEMNSEEAAKFFVREGRVVTTPGSGFGSHGDDFIRISFATSPDIIEAAMDNIRRCLHA
ncbi:MAG: pyridoxal phosphate-dependent aminotransferase [Nitrososphaerales archaeon]